VVEGDWDMLRPSDYEGVGVPRNEQVEGPAQNTAQARKRPSPLLDGDGFGTGLTGHDVCVTFGRTRHNRTEGSGETAVGSELDLAKVEMDEGKGVGGWPNGIDGMEAGDRESKRATGTTGLTLLGEL
jgi:hypothetical protein